MQQLAVLRLLADGERHSARALAEALGITQADVCEQISSFPRWGLKVDAQRRASFRLSRPIDLLIREKVLAGLDDDVMTKVAWLEVFPEIDSTNDFLLNASPPSSNSLSVCLAEFQRTGRGRHGRRWYAPFGGGLCLSLGWCFDEVPRDLAALSLAVGLVVRDVVHSVTGRWASLKWPNDLIWNDRKLGGILVETSPGSQGRCYVVIGIGINIWIEADWLEAVSDWPHGAVDLYRMTEGKQPSRNALASQIIQGLEGLLDGYPAHGFQAQHAEFLKANYLKGLTVAVSEGKKQVLGEVVDVDVDGALVVRTGLGNRRILSGEVNVRL